MKRVIGVFAAGLAILALPALTFAQGSAAQAKPPAQKTLMAMGTVSAVETDSLTVKGTKESWTFTIDKETSVRAKGATTKTLELKKEGKGTKLTDFVKVGDKVTVSYHDMGAMKHAANIQVTSPAK